MNKKTSRRLLCIAMVFFWASEYCHAPYFTPYLHSLQMGSTLVGIIISCYGFTQMLVRICCALDCELWDIAELVEKKDRL